MDSQIRWQNISGSHYESTNVIGENNIGCPALNISYLRRQLCAGSPCLMSPTLKQAVHAQNQIRNVMHHLTVIYAHPAMTFMTSHIQESMK